MQACLRGAHNADRRALRIEPDCTDAHVAEAYGGAAKNYVGALFTGHDTLGNIWANSFSKQGNAFSFASTRTAGMTVQMDPDHTSGKYYRAITGDMSGAVVGPARTVGTVIAPVPAWPAIRQVSPASATARGSRSRGRRTPPTAARRS